MEPRRYLLKTLGCKANLYDTQLLESELQSRGWSPAHDGETAADLCIVNSCTVTDEADKQSRKLATRLSRLNPAARVVLTGCSAEVDPERLAATPGVDFVVGNQNKPQMIELILNAWEKGREATADEARGEVLGGVSGYGELVSRHPMDREWPLPAASFFTPEAVGHGQTGRTRSFIKVQEGCNSFCTYCIIPYGRGPNRSLPISVLVEQVRALVAQGVREVVVTGTNIGDYGTDWAPAPQHARLFEAILRETALERLRVSSLDPTEIDEDVLKLAESEPRFCPHFHVSLQSPHSRILKLMKRKYSALEVERCLSRVAELPAPAGGVFVGMDVITGFPGESLEAFEAGVAQLERLPWSRLHVFPYSEREGTPATRLPDAVPMNERLRRARVLRELSFTRLESVNRAALASSRHRGQPLTGILLESVVPGPDGQDRWLSGYTSNYLRVLLPMEGRSLADWRNRTASAWPETLVLDRAAGDVALTARWA